ncbi:MAG: hypothetical protein R2769_08285 [Saprospiraceae bacterium]
MQVEQLDRRIVPQVDAGTTVTAAFELNNMYNQVGPYSYHTPVDQIITLDEISVSIFNSDDTNAQDVTAKVEIESIRCNDHPDFYRLDLTHKKGYFVRF